jgi:hypothetical protein
VSQVLAEAAHFHLRAWAQVVELLGHLLARSDDVVLVAVVEVFQESGRGRRRRGACCAKAGLANHEPISAAIRSLFIVNVLGG